MLKIKINYFRYNKITFVKIFYSYYDKSVMYIKKIITFVSFVLVGSEILEFYILILRILNMKIMSINIEQNIIFFKELIKRIRIKNNILTNIHLSFRKLHMSSKNNISNLKPSKPFKDIVDLNLKQDPKASTSIKLSEKPGLTDEIVTNNNVEHLIFGSEVY